MHLDMPGQNDSLVLHALCDALKARISGAAAGSLTDAVSYHFVVNLVEPWETHHADLRPPLNPTQHGANAGAIPLRVALVPARNR